MRILYLNHNVLWRSTFHRCYNFARELVNNGHSVTILTNSANSRLWFKVYFMEGIEIVESPDLFWGSLRTGWDPINAIRRSIYVHGHRYDIIHAFDTRPTVIVPALLYKFANKKVPLFIDWADWWGRGGAIELRHNVFLNKLFAPIETFFEEYFRKYATHTTVISTKLKKRAEALGLDRKNISIIYTGSGNFRAVQKSTARRLLAIPHKHSVFIFVGFVHYDIDQIFKFIDKIYAKEKKITLLIVGQVPSSKHVTNNDLLKKGIIRIIPPLKKKDVDMFLSASDIGLLPMKDNITNQARFPNKFFDYIAAGLPIVSSNVGDVGRIIQKFGLGILAKDLLSAKTRVLLLLNNKHEQRNISKSGRKLASTDFSSTTQVKHLLRLYTQSKKTN